MAEVLDVDDIRGEIIEAAGERFIHGLVAVAIPEMGDVNQPKRYRRNARISCIQFVLLGIGRQERILKASEDHHLVPVRQRAA